MKNKTKDTMKLSNFDTITVIRYTRQIIFFRFEKYFNLEVRVIKIDLFKCQTNVSLIFKNIIIEIVLIKVGNECFNFEVEIIKID